MNYDEYAAITEGLNQENALDVVTKMLEKVHEDCLAYDAEKAKADEDIKALNDKLVIAKADYIRLYNTSLGPAPVDDEPAEIDQHAEYLADLETRASDGLRY